MSYAPIPRAAAERLKALLAIRDKADAEAAGIMAGLAWGLGIDPTTVTGVDDGESPALLLKDPE
jgi:hypothetical protein